jgi:NADPH:quinone reductase-like Zn-dependent oxidoreductase
MMILRGSYQPRFPLPVTPGYDLVGTVAAVGAGVTRVKVGDRIAAMPQHGCMAEAVVLPEALCIPIDAGVPADKAVSVVLTGVTAYQMLHRAGGERLKRITPDTAVLIHGAAGGTGAMLVELAKLAGVAPARIFGTCSAKNVESVRARGITALDYEAPSPQRWDERVRDATQGRGVDLVLDGVVGGGYRAKGLSLLARGGKYISYGFTSKAHPGGVSIPGALWHFATLAAQQYCFSWFYGREATFYSVNRRRDAHPHEFATDLRALLALVAEGKLQPVIGKVWAFEEAREALHCIEKGQHRGKQVIAVAAAS